MWITDLIVDGWPVFASLLLLIGITYGALTPYIRRERRRRAEQERMDD